MDDESLEDLESLDDFEHYLGTQGYEYFDDETSEEPRELDFESDGNSI